MKIELVTSYAEKDIVKRNGAKWNPTSKKWYLESQNITELTIKIDTIAKELSKNIKDVAPEMPQELYIVIESNTKQNEIISPKEYIEKILSLNGMVEGNFTENKPKDSKTITGWLKEGFLPKSIDFVKTYKYSSDGKTGYQYIAENDVRPMTNEEKIAYEEIAVERKRKASEKAAQTREIRKTEKSTNTEIPTRDRLDAIKSFIEFKGLTEDFEKYYDEYCKNNPIPKKKKEKIFGSSNKKIKHLPNYAEIQGKKVLCFDTETTGFSPDKGDELLQVALVALENGEIKTQFESLVKPHEKTSWVGAMIKNHISPKMVENAPFPEDIKEQVQTIVSQADVIVGYNIDFDINFLEKCMGIDFSNKIIADPSDYFRQNKPESSSFNLESCVTSYCTAEDLAEYKSNAHKADTDAIATLKAFCSQARVEGHDLLLLDEKELS